MCAPRAEGRTSLVLDVMWMIARQKLLLDRRRGTFVSEDEVLPKLGVGVVPGLSRAVLHG